MTNPTPHGQVPEELTGDKLREIARSARTSASDSASPEEYVLAGWRAAQAAALTQPAVLTSATGGDWMQPTTISQRLGDAVQLLCGGKRPSEAMVAGWLSHSSEELQSFCAEHGPAWAQGIGLIDAAMVMVDQPTGILTPESDVDHERTEDAPAQVSAVESNTAERTGCTAGTDEECTRRGCATSCSALRIASHGQAPAHVLHLVQDAFAEVAMAYPKAFALHKVGLADTAVRKALATPSPQAAQQAPAGANLFDEQGFRDWVLRNLPDDTIIGNGAWWADHLTERAKRFMKAARAAPSTPASPTIEGESK